MLTLAADSVLALPDGAAYVRRVGRTTLSVRRGGRSGSIVVEARTDSVAREVRQTELRSGRVFRSEATSGSTHERTERRRLLGLDWPLCAAFLVLSGLVIALTVVIIKKREKDG